MSAKNENGLKRGDKQLVALEIINSLPIDYVFEDMTARVGEACFPDKGPASRESQARHLIRYLVRYQDEIAVNDGKSQTLRAQGRIIRAEFVLKKPNGRKTPVKKDKTIATITGEKRGSAERLAMIKAAAKNLHAKQATKRIEELASSGAHRFAGPTIIENREEILIEEEAEA